ncbi:MAG TPA: hypothetical protein PLJ71_16260 [Candidatus Hydrogenedentes bacterium]|nr:hypothetical protein [Candidatus Hydrogenedentota bacterium]
MRTDGRVSANTIAIAYDDKDFAEFLPYLKTLYGVAWHFTRDTRRAEMLIEKALVASVAQKHAADAPFKPKMALLSALREAYIQSEHAGRRAPARS